MRTATMPRRAPPARGGMSTRHARFPSTHVYPLPMKNTSVYLPDELEADFARPAARLGRYEAAAIARAERVA
jgi:hypothetical protein